MPNQTENQPKPADAPVPDVTKPTNAPAPDVTKLADGTEPKRVPVPGRQAGTDTSEAQDVTQPPAVDETTGKARTTTG